MPKRAGYLYERMLDRDLIRQTVLEGTRGKRRRRDVQRVLADVEGYTERIYRLLESGGFRPAKPREMMIRDKCSGKERRIQMVPYFPDGLVHQLCVAAMRDVLMRGMYRWSCASIPGRGNRCAANYVRRALNRDAKGTKYCLKMDIRQYYPSMDRTRLLRALGRKIKDRRFLRLLEDILWSTGEGGLAIGYYLDQWLANFYLEELDRLILRQPGVKYYVRNMDDMVILGPNKRKLHRARKAVAEYLSVRCGMCLKGDWQVFPVSARPIDFVGYRFYRDHTTMRRRNFLRMTRQCRRAQKRVKEGKAIPRRMAAGILSRCGQLKHCDGQKAMEKYLYPLGEARLKEAVRNGRKDPGRALHSGRAPGGGDPPAGGGPGTGGSPWTGGTETDRRGSGGIPLLPGRRNERKRMSAERKET
uniref:Reverse transcriptase domain-containing protein n=1 Tax=Podoviridae sp. ctzMH52 TaxID=2826596 RepID=A0A8S5N2F2_9CAUD|nr:MAG TPA: hypothetical protein [Podoviridae sp. ctzMH52]